MEQHWEYILIYGIYDIYGTDSSKIQFQMGLYSYRLTYFVKLFVICKNYFHVA